MTGCYELKVSCIFANARGDTINCQMPGPPGLTAHQMSGVCPGGMLACGIDSPILVALIYKLNSWHYSVDFYLFSKTTDIGNCSMLLSLLIFKNLLKQIFCLCFWSVPLRGKIQPHPDWYLFGVQLKFPDEHIRPFQYMGVPGGGRGGANNAVSRVSLKIVWELLMILFSGETKTKQNVLRMRMGIYTYVYLYYTNKRDI